MERLPVHPEAEIGPFLRAIKATPEDDTPRLAFADWLQEHDDPRGEMMRWSCQLYRTPHGTPEWRHLWDKLLPWRCDGRMFKAWVPDDQYHRPKIDRLERGLLVLKVDEEAGGGRDLYPNIFAAIDQGWVEMASASFHGALDRILTDPEKQELRQALAATGATWFVHTGHERPPDDYEGEEPHTDDWELVGARELTNLVGVGAKTGTYTDKALAELRGHHGLRWLYMDGELTSVGLSHLTTMPSLEVVDVGTFLGVTPADILALASLKRVRELTLEINHMNDATRAAVRELRAALPNCQLVTRSTVRVTGVDPLEGT